MSESLSKLIPFFNNVSSEIELEFNKNSVAKIIPKGQFIAMEGEDCNYLPIVKSGIVRVYKLSPNGNEITLYRINPGESCILTISCLLSEKKFPAIAFTESETEVLIIDSRNIKSWINKYEIWRKFIFNYMSSTIFKVLALLESSAFNRTESRLIDFLINESIEQGTTISFTHQKIASELGTSREVVSRILKDLEARKLLHLSRGSIQIRQIEALKRKNHLIS